MSQVSGLCAAQSAPTQAVITSCHHHQLSPHHV